MMVIIIVNGEQDLDSNATHAYAAFGKGLPNPALLIA
jgi:hypothetical protein